LKDSFVPRSGVALVSVPGCDAEEIVDATDGRSICMVVSSVLATGDDAALVDRSIRARRHGRSRDTSLEPRGLLTVMAGDRSCRVGGEQRHRAADALEVP
jgi:hypothetical protein